MKRKKTRKETREAIMANDLDERTEPIIFHKDYLKIMPSILSNIPGICFRQMRNQQKKN